jgi:cell division protein ZapA
MAGDGVQVTVKILDREYPVACAEEERDALLAAAELVSERMREVRDRGNVIGTDRVAVMAALNMAHELLYLRETESTCERVRDQIDTLQQRVDAALEQDSA